jgi:hypothetical protein
MSSLRPTSLALPGLRARVVAALAAFLSAPAGRRSPAIGTDPWSLSGVLRHGDVLLTEGHTRAAALVKRVTKSPWSHVSMYVGPLEDGPDPRCIVEADIAAGVRAIRLSQLEVVDLRVLRPVGLDDADRNRLALWVVSRIGGEYDLRHASLLALALLTAPLKSTPPPPAAGMAESATRFICSTLLAHAFTVVGHSITAASTSARGAADHRYVVPSDFERASGFEVVGALASGA